MMKKRVIFANQVESEEPPPKPFPRSTSTNGLSSLSRSVIQAEERQNELCQTMSTVKEIIGKYENEIRVLKDNNSAQMKIIEGQMDELKVTKDELKLTKEEIKVLLAEIEKIWNS